MFVEGRTFGSAICISPRGDGDHVLWWDRDGWLYGAARRCDQKRYGLYGVSENAIFMPGRQDPQFSEWIAFLALGTLDGEQRYLDSHLSYQRAILHAIDYLATFGYSPEQAYLLLGAAR